MAGIYLHIPFCRQKCYYCDFYKTLNTDYTEQFIAALKDEFISRIAYLAGNSVKTIYFGGGTPSVLNESQIVFILNFIKENCIVEPDAEITLEANPDDLTADYLKMLKNAGINRLSIGIQSFNDELLKKMNRRHNSVQAVEAVENAAAAGFSNLSADLIYGLSGLTAEEWKKNLYQMFHLPVVHLSAYHLTYHRGTAFYTWLKKGTLKELSEKESIMQFEILLDETARAGFEYYEISNFARNGLYSKHNSSYWSGEHYLGIGPSAHSFNGKSRRWNIASTEKYIKSVGQNNSWFEEEYLSETEKYNEYILTRLRTKWGISLQEISRKFGIKNSDYVRKVASKYIQQGKLAEKDGILKLTKAGIFVSDTLIADFMII